MQQKGKRERERERDRKQVKKASSSVFGRPLLLLITDNSTIRPVTANIVVDIFTCFSDNNLYFISSLCSNLRLVLLIILVNGTVYGIVQSFVPWYSTSLLVTDTVVVN